PPTSTEHLCRIGGVGASASGRRAPGRGRGWAPAEAARSAAATPMNTARMITSRGRRLKPQPRQRQLAWTAASERRKIGLGRAPGAAGEGTMLRLALLAGLGLALAGCNQPKAAAPPP